MLNPNHHPDDETLAAIAAGDTDATSVASHLDACATCATLVTDLRTLRSSLAELPDIAPSRPLRFVPDVPSSDRPASWARRVFGPIMAGGAALTLVGMIGTTAPALFGLAGQAASAPRGNAATDQEVAASSDAETAPGVGGVTSEYGQEHDGASAQARPLDDAGETPTAEREALTAPAERSPWPMVLFTGVALMIAAALLRWILAPRAP